jgi:hypothetical protein
MRSEGCAGVVEVGINLIGALKVTVDGYADRVTRIQNNRRGTDKLEGTLAKSLQSFPKDENGQMVGACLA